MDKIIDIRKMDQNLNYQERKDLEAAFSALSQILLSQFKQNGLSIEKIELGEVDFLKYDSYEVNTAEFRVNELLNKAMKSNQTVEEIKENRAIKTSMYYNFYKRLRNKK